MEVIGRGLDELCNSQDIRDFDIRVQIVGSRDALPPRLRQAADGVEQHTANSTSGGVLTICLAYGGRQDLVYPSLFFLIPRAPVLLRLTRAMCVCGQTMLNSVRCGGDGSR